ncbi:hypothetical protein [Haploplasma axanthum]|uniref:Uncharacterized protein n=1 Tax=Haploplasma axanthum TaxID=29552 RepID=A0A449BDQ0_HAPAX|nr:hypothetical protein [Haploplasma axanthum]VEU80581.1 Uncharacterised protein [Haploplasma axanthum]
MKIKNTRIAICLVLAILGSVILNACKSNKVNFKYGSGEVIDIKKTVLVIVDDSSLNSIEFKIDEKYDDKYFETKSLIVIAFKTATNINNICNISLKKQDGILEVDVKGKMGINDVVDVLFKVLEVSREDIKDVKSLNLVTNLNKI